MKSLFLNCLLMVGIALPLAGSEKSDHFRLKGSTIQQPHTFRSSEARILIVDLMTDIPRKDVEKAVKAVKEQLKEDFAPLWGKTGKIKLLKRGEIPSTEEFVKSHSIIQFLFNDLVPEALSTWGTGAGNFWETLPPPNNILPTTHFNGDGPQPNLFIGTQIPFINYGTPVGLIPFGDGTYGISHLQTLFSNFTIGDTLSKEVSAQIMNLINAPFGGFNFDFSPYQITSPTPTEMDAIAMLTVNPVGLGDFNVYKRKGTAVSNFVLPQYYNPEAQPGTPLDFLGNVLAPLTPYGGAQFGFAFKCDGTTSFFEDSSPATDPAMVTRTTFSPLYNGTCPPSPEPLNDPMQVAKKAMRDINGVLK